MHWQGGCSSLLLCLFFFPIASPFLCSLEVACLHQHSTSCVPCLFFFLLEQVFLFTQGQSFSQKPFSPQSAAITWFFLLEFFGGIFISFTCTDGIHGQGFKIQWLPFVVLKPILIPLPLALLLRPFLHTCPFFVHPPPLAHSTSQAFLSIFKHLKLFFM